MAPTPVQSFNVFTFTSLGLLGLTTYYAIKLNRHQAAMSRRTTQALEMKVLRARLDRFHAKIDGGEVIDEEEIQEGKRAERLFQRRLRSMEEDAVADDQGRSVSPGWF